MEPKETQFAKRRQAIENTHNVGDISMFMIVLEFGTGFEFKAVNIGTRQDSNKELLYN